MLHQLLDELHEMIARMRKAYQSAVPVSEDDLQALHDKVNDVKEAAPATNAQAVTDNEQGNLLPVGDTSAQNAAAAESPPLGAGQIDPSASGVFAEDKGPDSEAHTG